MRSVWPRSVPRSEQSGIDHSFTRFDNEPVAHVREPGANATNPDGEVLAADSFSLLRGGKRWYPVSGEIHLARRDGKIAAGHAASSS